MDIQLGSYFQILIDMLAAYLGDDLFTCSIDLSKPL